MLIDEVAYSSATDLVRAAGCEYAALCEVDRVLGRSVAGAAAVDPLLAHIGRLGADHEARLLEQMRRVGSVVELDLGMAPADAASMRRAASMTLSAVSRGPDVIYQAPVVGADFFGYADFLERTADGWRVCDAKLARTAKPVALLQLAAYAQVLIEMGVPVAPQVSLLLGDGRRQDFPLRLLLPVLRERRDRLRDLIAAHRATISPADFGDPSLAMCGSCDHCAEAVARTNDVLLVAGMRMSQRRVLRSVGITTIAELAELAEPAEPAALPEPAVPAAQPGPPQALDPFGTRTAPAGMGAATFARLRSQAALQWRQLRARRDGDPTSVIFELTGSAADALARLPAASPGDWFFDFEGDPLYQGEDLRHSGLEYLWGMLDAGENYVPLWAHDRAGERAAFMRFVDLLTERRVRYPDMHVYHYAPYETSALKRLAARYQVREEALDNLLRAEVFVDLYATVVAAVRVSQPSYSIKKLEPLYMGDDLRASDVADGAGSVVAYLEYQELREVDRAAAARLLDSLADYNRYDCLSTLRLRDWLLARAADAGVADRIVIVPRTGGPVAPAGSGAGLGAGLGAGGADSTDLTGQTTAYDDPLFTSLMVRAGDADPGGRTATEESGARTAEQQTYAMLATALDYYRREHKQFWWGHFDRLGNAVEEWAETRDVFVVESARVISDWQLPAGGRARNLRRTVQLTGDWAAGSSPSGDAFVVYRAPGPPRASGPEAAAYAAINMRAAIAADPDDPRIVTLTESSAPDATYPDVPVAIAPGPPPSTDKITAAIREVALAGDADALPSTAAIDLLLRRPPRIFGTPLPGGGGMPADAIGALTVMADSYVAIQGPPGAGKTYVGSRVVKALVEHHHWRIGVVAQSHAVVENLLRAVIDAGLPAARVGKATGGKESGGKATGGKEYGAPAASFRVGSGVAGSPADSQAGPGADMRTGGPLGHTWSVLETGGEAAFLAAHGGDGCVIGGTAWVFTNEAKVGRGELDLLVIDEAGQFALAPTLAVSVAAKRLLLLGDPQQLPQVSQGTHAEPVDESALGWLMGGTDTIPPELGYFLPETYRMHPALCKPVSELSYGGNLRSAPAASERELTAVAPGLRVVRIDHAGCRTESPAEADQVVVEVRALIGTLWSDPGDPARPRPLAPGDFLVVAPYNAQVALIRERLVAAGLFGVRVGTVDRFQGQEAPVAIVSMTASSAADLPRGMDFLLNRNRINVAISRAQWQAILLRSTALTGYLPTSVAGLLELGAFAALG